MVVQGTAHAGRGARGAERGRPGRKPSRLLPTSYLAVGPLAQHLPTSYFLLPTSYLPTFLLPTSYLAVGPLAQHRAELQVRHLHAVSKSVSQ